MLRKQGVYAIIVIIALFMALHLAFAPEAHEPRTTGTTMLGGIAFLLMTTSMILSTRARFLEDLFGGLDRMYQVHKVTGTMSLIFVLIHFFGVPKELPAGVDEIANALVPSAPMGMIALIVLVLSLAITLNRKISYSRWRPMHKLMGLVYFLVIGHFMTAPAIFYERFSTSGILIFIAAIIGAGSFLYSVFGMNRKTALPYKLAAINAHERAKELVLAPMGAKMSFTPGQFAFVEVAGKDWNEPHPFTISSAPDEDNLRFTIKVLGDWTRKVREELEAGGEVKVRGPYGRFDMSKGGNKQIWLAGGIGITPFLSTIRNMKDDDERDIHLVYATREEKEALFLDELLDHAKRLKGLKIIPLFSDEGNFARVDIMEEKLPDALPGYDYFLCGPKAMTGPISKDLKAKGVSHKQIHMEAFEFR
ncbi:ferric reductase-like transmembrane domain-containing protein [Lentilitoribacter sp. EG35]|uniref:ferredoxin reductase family protein n=1 Tax=Lentilitoribacter sp. EG35 TaxID=3234192 RepID=UPI00345F19FD